ncbi:hypothetical protein ACOSQ2_017543 [Xanthoceras sorbifolium]
MLPKKLIDRMIKSPHTLRKQLFPEEISGHNLHDSGETKADVVHPIPPPLVLDMDNLKKAPVMDDGATSDSVDSLLVSLQGVENRSHATHATKEGMSHIDSTKHEQLNSLNSLCVEQLVGSLSLPLPQDTVSRIKSDKKKKWKRLARFEMQGQEAMIPNSSLGERLSVEEAIVVNSVSKKGRVSHSLDEWRGKIVLFIGVASILKSVGRTKKNVKKLFQIVGLIFMARLLCIKWFSKLTVLLKY